jgi:hypothetical protein
VTTNGEKEVAVASSPTPDAQDLEQPPRPALTFGTVAWLVVVAAVALVQLSRQAWPDAAVLAVALVALLLDVTGRLPRPQVEPLRQGWFVLLVALVVAVVLVLAPRHGAVAGTAVATAGAAAAIYAWPDRTGDLPEWDWSMTRTATAWTAAWVAGCLWELAMFLLGGRETDGRERYPAASDLLDPLLAHPVLKAAFVLVWVGVGVELIARVDRR